MSDKTDPIVTAMMALHKANTDLLWSLEWVNSLIDDLNTGRESEHPRTLEFLTELSERRTDSVGLDCLAKEVWQ
jgi:hypothetical protein